MDCGSKYVGWKEMGFVLEVEYGGREKVWSRVRPFFKIFGAQPSTCRAR